MNRVMTMYIDTHADDDNSQDAQTCSQRIVGDLPLKKRTASALIK